MLFVIKSILVDGRDVTITSIMSLLTTGGMFADNVSCWLPSGRVVEVVEDVEEVDEVVVVSSDRVVEVVEDVEEVEEVEVDVVEVVVVVDTPCKRAVFCCL